MMYTKENLTKINDRFIGAHIYLHQSDVDMANKFSDLIEKSRSTEMPKPGDVVRFTDKCGNYYPVAHIEEITEDGRAYICENASVYVVNETSFSSSGGTWHFIPLKEMKYVGQTEKNFWRFGHCGACADGGINFYAKVNVWEYSENEEEYTTEKRDRYTLSYSDIYDKEYRYFANNYGIYEKHRAFKTELELQAWLRTFRAKVFSKGNNNVIVWTYKENQHHVSPKEYEEIAGIEDTMTFNGARRRCKRIYDDENSTVHTYFVWYWDDPEIEDFRKRSMQQNETRKQYELDWFAHSEYEYARNELETGKVKPVEIKF